MRARPVLLLLCLAITAGSPALAEPTSLDASDTREAAMVFEAVPLKRDQVGWHVRADVLAAALASSAGKDRQRGGAGTVSAEVGLAATPDCDLVAAGGQLATRSDDHVVSAQQWASICPLGGDGNLTVDHRLEWDVSPRLLAAPRLRPGSQRRETIGVSMYGSTRPLYDRGPLTLLPERDWEQGGTMRLEVQVGWSDHDTSADVRPVFDVVLRNYRHDEDDGPPLTLALFTARLEGNLVAHAPDAPTVVSLSSDLARVEGVRAGRVRFGGRLGGRVVMQAVGREMTYRQQGWFIGEADASAEYDLVRGLTTRLAGERAGWPAYDGRYVVDDRVTWSLFGHRGRLSGRLDVSAASTHLLAIGDRHDVTTGGVTTESELDLGAGFGVKLRSELGRSVYARGATLDEPRWASETLLMLAAHLEHSRRPAHPVQ
jgi:hypothetical protein